MENKQEAGRVGKEIKRIVDWQFRGVTNLYPKAYGSSINMIKDQILAIKGLRIEKDDQTLPKFQVQEPFSMDGRNNKRIYESAQADMLKPDKDGYWMKVRPK